MTTDASPGGDTPVAPGQQRQAASTGSQAVGLLVLSTDKTPARELIAAFAKLGLRSEVEEVFYANPITVESLRQIANGIDGATRKLPAVDDLLAVAFCCTAATIALGFDKIEALIQAVRPGVTVVTPATAAVETLKRHGAIRIAVLTPYPPEVAANAVRFFRSAGFDIVHENHLGMTDDREIGELDRSFIERWIDGNRLGQPDAIFVSCTAVPAFAIAEAMEARLGIPVLTSNRAVAIQIGAVWAGR